MTEARFCEGLGPVPRGWFTSLINLRPVACCCSEIEETVPVSGQARLCRAAQPQPNCNHGWTRMNTDETPPIRVHPGPSVVKRLCRAGPLRWLDARLGLPGAVSP